jgi:1-acyl-sn-glycerol-3-phosphate acyltransferase
MSTKVPLVDLFNHGRIKEKASAAQKLMFLLYLPLGVLVFITRLVLFIVLCVLVLVLPRALGDPITRPLTRLVCGLVVRHNYKGDVGEPYVLAANHVSDFDTFASWVAIPRYRTITGAHLKLIPIIGRVYSKLDAIYVAPTPESRAMVKDTLQKASKENQHPILIFPEGGLTNGQAGTMMYHRFVFGLDCAIVPMAISMSDPWPVNHDYIGSTWFRNFFWFLFVPFHVFDITFLPSQRRQENETPEEFAMRVQKLTSAHLKIEATKYSYSEKKELVKRLASGEKLNYYGPSIRVAAQVPANFWHTL